MGVIFLFTGLVEMGMGVNLVAVGVLVLVLHMGVVMGDMRVLVRLAAVFVGKLVCACGLVGVLFSHDDAPSGLTFLIDRLAPDLGLTKNAMLNVSQRLVQQAANMSVIEAVDRAASLPPAHYQSQVAEHPELMRNRRLRHVRSGGQLTDRTRPLTKLGQNAHPASRGQRRHHPSDMFRGLGADRTGSSDAMILSHAHMLACA